MAYNIKIHYKNISGFVNPDIVIWYEGSSLTSIFQSIAQDTYGYIYHIPVARRDFYFKFKESGSNNYEEDWLTRYYTSQRRSGDNVYPDEIWCKGDKAFIYHQEPAKPEAISAEDFLTQLPFKPDMYIPDTGGLSGLGAHVLQDGRVLFGLYHPNASRVYLMGSFNNWIKPETPTDVPPGSISMKLYRGYFDYPNIWLVVHNAHSQ